MYHRPRAPHIPTVKVSSPYSPACSNIYRQQCGSSSITLIPAGTS
jgi:hypothetical protein